MRKLVCLGTMLIWLIVGTGRVEAKSYSIDKVNIEAWVEKDGSMRVSEKRMYNFDGSYTFAYLDINKTNGGYWGRNQLYVIDDFEVCEKDVCYTPIAKGQENASDDLRPEGNFYAMCQVPLLLDHLAKLNLA